MSGRAAIAVMCMAVVAEISSSGSTGSASSVALVSKALVSTTQTVALSQAVLTAGSDTYANQAATATNYGTQAFVDVQSQTASKNRRTYLRFDLTTLPGGATIHSATLQFTLGVAPAASRTMQLRRASSAWVETTLTWANMPAVSGTVSGTVATGTSAGAVLGIDVTVDARAMFATSSTNFGWRLADLTESSASLQLSEFRSREYAIAADRPLLIVTYS